MRLFASYRKPAPPRPEDVFSETLTPDICVIGAGSGGLSVAAAAAAFGVSVVLVEKAKMGGDCLNYGCVPSKALIAAGKLAHAMRSAEEFGIKPVEPIIEFPAVMRHVREVIASIAPSDSVERFTALGVRIIKAEARFRNKRTVVAGDIAIRARRFVIATGSSPLVPPVPGLDTVEFMTNETVFDLERKPGHLIVIGGGPIGVELAQAFGRLGSRVTVIEASAALNAVDPEMSAIALAAVRGEGVAVREKTTVARVERRGKTGVRVFVETPVGEVAIDGTHILVAAGRRPNVETLGLDKAHIDCTPKGIKVSAMLRTRNRRVYAIGDVAGSLQFTHVANYHASLVLRGLLFRLPAKQKPIGVPWAIFTDPEIAHIGLNEAGAAKAHGKVRILRWPYAENDRAQAERKIKGHIKLVVGKKGKILGVTIVGAGASEMINIWSLAWSKGLGLRDMAGIIAPYPTMTEIGKRAAIAYFAPSARSSLVRGALRVLRLFG